MSEHDKCQLIQPCIFLLLQVGINLFLYIAI